MTGAGHLIRKAFRAFYRLKHEKCLIQSGAQIHRPFLGAPQIGNNFGLANDSAANANADTGANKANVYQANQMAEGRSSFESYNGAKSGLDRQFAAGDLNGPYGINSVIHGQHPLKLKSRFGLACRAFVNAWRAA